MKKLSLTMLGMALLGLQGCADAQNEVEYLNGPMNAEDILRIGDTGMLLASGMNGEISGTDTNGHIYLVAPADRSYSEIFPTDNPMIAHDRARFGVCPGPIDTSNISVHGLSLRETDTSGVYDLYTTGHGAREAIEVFSLDMRSEPAVSWIGCVPMNPNVMMNSVTILEDGGLMATQFLEWNNGAMEAVQSGEITGAVYEWHPGGEVEMIPGTELSGANGILFNEDAELLFVASYGSGGVVRYDLSQPTTTSETINLAGIHPDNLRYTNRDTILAAGGKNSGGWAVYEIDPLEMTSELVFDAGPEVSMQGISVAEEVGGEIWVGTYAGDRLGIITE